MHFDPWTLALQAANFLVLLWLLQRFLYRPVLAIIAERQAAADKLTAEVKANRDALEAQRQSLADQQAALDARADAALAAARDAAEAERKALLAKATAEAEAAKVEANAAFERERAEVVRTAGRDAARLAVLIARRLLSDGSEAAIAAIQERMLDLACSDVRALPAETRRSIVERLAAGQTRPEVVTAAPLDEKAAGEFGRGLGDALGAPVEPAFRVDSGLIAGVEIRFPYTILRRSWAESLQRIEAELIHDDHAAKVS